MQEFDSGGSSQRDCGTGCTGSSTTGGPVGGGSPGTRSCSGGHTCTSSSRCGTCTGTGSSGCPSSGSAT